MTDLNFDPMTEKEAEMLTLFTAKINKLTDEQLHAAATILRWRTYGLDGKQSMKVFSLNELDTSHLENILITQDHIGAMYRKVIIWLLKKRWTSTTKLT